MYTRLVLHGRWILTKNGKYFPFAVQTEKTEMNILQKNGKESLFTFYDRREKLFLNCDSIFCPLKYSSSKKLKRQTSDRTEEFSMEQALRGRGSYY